jgi:hypothetical protein
MMPGGNINNLLPYFTMKNITVPDIPRALGIIGRENLKKTELIP